MGASPIVRAMYEELIRHFGEPDGSVTFTEPPPPDESWPDRIDVLHWADTEDLDINTFATVGMCDRPMAHVAHRCEIHFSIRARAEDLDIPRICAFCADLTAYPFRNETFFDWTQTLVNPGGIPHFPNCRSIMLHPAFVKDGWDTMIFEGLKVQIMNVVPLTVAEMAYRKEHGPFSIYDYIIEHEIDLFSDVKR